MFINQRARRLCGSFEGVAVLHNRHGTALKGFFVQTRIIHTKIHFEDDWFNTLPIGHRYLFIYLFTNSHIGQTGIYKLSKRVALLETNATEKEWNDACKRFSDDNKVKFVEDWVCIINAKRYANYSGALNEKAYTKEWESIPKTIRDTVSIQYIYPMHTAINKKSEIINKKPEIENHKLETINKKSEIINNIEEAPF